MACCYYRVPSRTGSLWVTMLLRARGYQFLISVATNSLRVMRLVQEHNALNQSGIAKFATTGQAINSWALSSLPEFLIQ